MRLTGRALLPATPNKKAAAVVRRNAALQPPSNLERNGPRCSNTEGPNICKRTAHAQRSCYTSANSAPVVKPNTIASAMKNGKPISTRSLMRSLRPPLRRWPLESVCPSPAQLHGRTPQRRRHLKKGKFTYVKGAVAI